MQTGLFFLGKGKRVAEQCSAVQCSAVKANNVIVSVLKGFFILKINFKK